MTHASRLLVPLCLALPVAACGGGGGANGVASTPPPPPPPSSPTVTSTDVVKTPLSSADHYGLTGGDFPTLAVFTETAKSPDGVEIGAQTAAIAASGDVRVSFAPASGTYTLEFNRAGYPASEVFDLGNQDPEFGNHIVKTDHYSDGTSTTSEYDATTTHIFESSIPSPGAAEFRQFDYSADLQYVSLGVWSLEYGTSSGTSTTGSIFDRKIATGFVAGRRTEPGELPANGSASYRVLFQDLPLQPRTISDSRAGYSLSGAAGQLVADFSARTIAASIDLGFEDYVPDPQFTVTGSDAITSSGDFQIAVSGSRPGPDAPFAAEPVDGVLQGAFFGPNAEETGGVMQLQQGGEPIYAGAFVGAKN